jgi:hypothetical protein
MRRIPDEVIEQAEQDGADWYGKNLRRLPEEHIEIILTEKRNENQRKN